MEVQEQDLPQAILRHDRHGVRQLQGPASHMGVIVFQMASSKNGMAAREVERTYGLSPKTSWFVCHRIREAMKLSAPYMLSGTIVADETWIGGDPKNRHHSQDDRFVGEKAKPWKPSWQASSNTDKQPVFALINVETGEVRSQVVNDVTARTLRKAIVEHVKMVKSILYTDESESYLPIGPEFKTHQTVNHSKGEYVAPRGHHEPPGGLLLAAQALHRRDPPPRQPGAPAPLPDGVRLPLLHLQDDRHRPDTSNLPAVVRQAPCLQGVSVTEQHSCDSSSGQGPLQCRPKVFRPF